MFRLCCTKKVLKRLKTKPEVDPPASTTTLSDWYVDVLILRPRHLLLFVNEKTRLPIVTEAAPIADLQPRFVVALFKQLLAIGIKPHLVDAEMGAMDQMGQMVVAKTASRSVLGTILDFRYAVEAAAGYGDHHNLPALSLHLVDTPCGPLRMDSPRMATRAAFGLPPLS